MSNPLQPKVIKCLENEYNAFTVNVTAASRSGVMDVLACIKGRFYGFEVKWKSDKPSQLQKQKINTLTEAGGRGYFIRSVEQLRYTIDNDLPSEKYDLSTKLVL